MFVSENQRKADRVKDYFSPEFAVKLYERVLKLQLPALEFYKCSLLLLMRQPYRLN